MRSEAIKGVQVSFSKSFVICDWELVSGQESTIARANILIHQHRFEHNQLHNRPGHYGALVSTNFFRAFMTILAHFLMFFAIFDKVSCDT